MVPIPELSLVFILCGPSTVTLQVRPTLRPGVRLFPWSQVFWSIYVALSNISQVTTNDSLA